MNSHLFQYSDVYRIVRVVRPSTAADIPFIFGTILQGDLDLLDGLRALGFQIVPQQELVAFLLKFLAFLYDVAVGGGVLDQIVQTFLTLVGIVPAPAVPPPAPA